MFRGRAVAEDTTYRYDDDGRLAASRTVREPAWLDTDAWLAVALQAYEQSLCDGCGQPKDRAFHPDMDGWYDVDVIECAGCGALADGTPKAADHRHKLTVHDTRPPNDPLPVIRL